MANKKVQMHPNPLFQTLRAEKQKSPLPESKNDSDKFNKFLKSQITISSKITPFKLQTYIRRNFITTRNDQNAKQGKSHLHGKQESSNAASESSISNTLG